MSENKSIQAGARTHTLAGCCAMGLCGPERAEAVRLMNKASRAMAAGNANFAADIVRQADALIAKAEGRQ